ncbi:MAG TPA: hypothetical protein VND91_02485 [Candidatus Saccharimonadia bacterium]|nr:hypothetical protein [Candidatus Saccharimonadia bacterium]
MTIITTLRLTALVAATALASTAALANPQGHGTKNEFKSLDRNGDGKLSSAEVPASNPLSAHFAVLDTNKDGFLSRPEFAKHHRMHAPGRAGTAPGHQPGSNNEFAALDRNRDGRLTAAELPAGHALAPHFTRLDPNKDGSLSQGEYSRRHPK